MPESPVVKRDANAPLPTRVYVDAELQRLNGQCRSFLVFLEQMGLLDVVTRELVIDRVMALECDEVELDEFKWVVLMVLFNQPGAESMYPWMEDFVFEGGGERLH